MKHQSVQLNEAGETAIHLNGKRRDLRALIASLQGQLDAAEAHKAPRAQGDGQPDERFDGEEDHVIGFAIRCDEVVAQ